jgi:hypothetical protein
MYEYVCLCVYSLFTYTLQCSQRFESYPHTKLQLAITYEAQR